MAWSDISIQCMQRNPEGATRLGLFLGLGSDPNDWEDGHIKPLLIEKKLNDKISFNFTSFR